MYKRRRSDTLTGGTRDVNPQFMHLTAVQSAADTATTTAFPIPVQRLQNAGRAQVMEVLKVYWSLPAGIDTADNSIRVFLSTSSNGATALDFGNTRVFAATGRVVMFNVDGTFTHNVIYETDLTDGGAHGVLIGTDNIYMQVTSSATGLTNTVFAKILYRWKDVSTIEYVGIVQGQQ